MHYPSIEQYKNLTGKLFIAKSMPWSEKSFLCNNLENAYQYINENNTSENNLYYSTATYKTNSRSHTKNMIDGVQEFFVDIDNQDHAILNVNNAYEFIDELVPYFDKEMPKPTRITYTGHGLQFKFVVGQDLTKDVTACEDIGEALRNRLNELMGHTSYFFNYGYKVDDMCKSIGGMARLENTYNVKDPLIKLQTKIIYQSDNVISRESLKPFDLKIYGESLSKVWNRRATKKEKSAIFSINDILDNQEPTQIETLNKKEWSLKTSHIWRKTNRNRLKDLETLQRLRNEANYNEGYRNIFIREYATVLKCIEFDQKAFFETLLDVNEWFNEPLNKNEVMDWAKSIWNNGKQTRQHKNETIVRVLGITEAERQELTTLIMQKEYMQRYYIAHGEAIRANSAKAYAEAKETNAKAKRLRNAKIIKLKANGLPIKEIAKKVGCSRSTVKRVLNK